MSLQQRILWIALLSLATTARIGIADDAFDDAKVGSLPSGWSAAKTGTGDGSVWRIQEDATAPSGKRVLTQTSSVGPSPLFNLCIADKPRLIDVDFTVSLKALSGKIDQGGRPVWRYQDENNYYIARVNPLENNFRVYKVIGGKRTQLGTADAEAATGKFDDKSICLGESAAGKVSVAALLKLARWCQERRTSEQGSASCLHATRFPPAQCSADRIAEPGAHAGSSAGSVVAAVGGYASAVDCVGVGADDRPADRGDAFSSCREGGAS